METKILKKIKSHWPVLILAIIIGFLMIWPFLYFQAKLGSEYKGILNQIIDDEIFYMARIQDVIDGHTTLGNAYLLEHKDQLPQQLFLPEFLLAQPLKFLNLDMVQGRIMYNFILPAFVFILTYIAFYLIHPSRFWANIFTVFLIFGPYLFKFTRPVIPQFVFLFWLTQFIFLWRFIKGPTNRLLKYLNILNFGFLFYLYPFYWTFYLIFLAILIIFYWFRERLLSKQLLIILFGGLAIGSVYFYLTFLASHLPEYQETLTRLQLVISRSPSEIKTVLPAIFILVLIAVLYRLKKITLNRETLFFTAGVISILIVINQNIITSQKFEFGHYRMSAMFFLVFAVYYLLVPIFKLLNLKLKFLLAFLIIIFSAYSTYGYIQRSVNIFEEDFYRQKYRVIFNWLNENTFPDSVVYADEDISSLIPVYTSNNVFYSRYANLFLMPDKEAGDKFIINNFFEKFDRDFIIENERSIWGVRYIDKYGDAVQANKWRKFLGFGLKDETRLPEEEINKILAEASRIQSSSFEKELKNYRVDYFILDKEKNPGWRLESQSFLEDVFKDGNFVIYHLK